MNKPPNFKELNTCWNSKHNTCWNCKHHEHAYLGNLHDERCLKYLNFLPPPDETFLHCICDEWEN